LPPFSHSFISFYLQLYTVPSSPPESPQCDVLGSTSIYITWSPPDIDGQNGKIKGYKVFYISVDELYGKSFNNAPIHPFFLSHLTVWLQLLLRVSGHRIVWLANYFSGSGIGFSMKMEVGYWGISAQLCNAINPLTCTT